ncbi:MAG: hypothetical protein AAF682_31580, partial [Planctomycetota bacterium]
MQRLRIALLVLVAPLAWLVFQTFGGVPAAGRDVAAQVHGQAAPGPRPAPATDGAQPAAGRHPVQARPVSYRLRPRRDAPDGAPTAPPRRWRGPHHTAPRALRG